MGLRFEIPGDEAVQLQHLLLDVNGTLTDRGALIPGVAERMRRLATELEVHLLSADTFETLDELAAELNVEGRRVASGAEKRSLAGKLGAGRCAAVGNGRNDAEMLGDVRLGIAVIGPEGASRTALDAADIACPSIQSALDLLLDPRALAATLRP